MARHQPGRSARDGQQPAPGFCHSPRLTPGLRGMIEGGNTAAACMLVGIQVAVALLNAGAMAG